MAKEILNRQSILALLLCFVFICQTSMRIKACGPETIDPIFVFTNSPDIPFEKFAKGKIGILQSSFGRKSLVIAHRYLNGGTFTEDEQRGVVEALKGIPPEEDDDSAIKAWIEARKEIVGNEQTSPAIYDQRRHSGYDFFPNCTRNAFEVATQTLKDRALSYGANDANVRNWLDAQDIVFKNCAEGAEAPPPVGRGAPNWLQKDRDYQIAAANFYSLRLAEARSRFEKIGADNDSVWQEISAYLVGRTLVRQASLTKNERESRANYEQAEAYLINLLARGGKFQNATKRLLGLVKFRLHPEERIRELSQILDKESGNENIRQDLIDYYWLLDKFDLQIQKEEEERKKKLNPTPTPEPYGPDPEVQKRNDAIQRGELIEIYFSPDQPEGSSYQPGVTVWKKPDVSEAEVFQEVEIQLGRKLSEAEIKKLKDNYTYALSRRQWLLSPNRKVNTGRDYEGCHSDCNQLTLAMLPAYIRTDDLSDWIMTFQSKDPKAFAHSASKWRLTHSTAWLAVALTKATKTSRGLLRLMRDAEQVEDESPVYPTVAYHLIRLRMDMNRTAEAQKMLDKIIATHFDSLPLSSQNLFLEQRAGLAGTVDEYLKFAIRQPVAFYEYGSVGRILDLLEIHKQFWDPEYYTETKEEYEKKTEESFKNILPWNERKTFDPDIADLFNWHFSMNKLIEAMRSSEVPDYLRRGLALSVWTRAVLLKNDLVAKEVSSDIERLVPELAPLFSVYVKAQTRERRESEALFILLKYPTLSPYVAAGIQQLSTAEEEDYYFETSWWCKPDDTIYQDDGTEIPKVVSSPKFLNARDLAIAKKEKADLAAIGDAKSFLGKRVLEWARRFPSDPRIPEALYIAIQANQSYKYGCGSWEEDEETRTKLEAFLKDKYAESSWAAKLKEQEKDQ